MSRGLTLLEVLIATTISTVVLGSAFWLLSGGLATGRRLGESAVASQEYELIAKRLRTELAGAFYAPLFADSFQGQEKKLQFSYPTAKGLAQVRWASKADGIWQQRREPAARNWSAPVRLAEKWQGSFSYLDQDGRWQQTWDSEEQEALPRLVRLVLTGKSERQLTIALEGSRVIPY